MAKTEDVRAVNLKKIKEVFLAEGICTKNMLAKKTGLSLGTCTNLLKYLIEHQMIRRIEDSASTGGRKAKRYQLIDNAVYYGLVYYDQKQFYVEKIDIRGKTIESKITVNASWVDSWCKQDFKKILFCGMDKEVYANATFYQRPVLVASYGYSQENHLDNVAFIYQASQELSHCGLVLNGRMFEGYSNFAGEMSYIPIENQENQMKMLKSKKEATSLMAKQIASLISIVNPQAIVVISEKVVSLEKLNAKILKWIDNKHLPQIAMEKDLAFWVLCGLKRVCLNESVEII